MSAPNPPSSTLGDLIAGRGRRSSLAAGQVLFREGDESTSVYVLLFGRVKVAVTTPNGREVVLGTKVPNQVFGELSAIDGRPRSAGVAATELAVVSSLQRDEFLDALTHAPELAVVLLRELSDQLRRLSARVAARDSENTTVRVGHLLIELADKFRRHGVPSAIATLPISQDEFAGWIGATREATARSLATFRRAGLIETGRNRIVITDPDGVVAATRMLVLSDGRLPAWRTE